MGGSEGFLGQEGENGRTWDDVHGICRRRIPDHGGGGSSVVCTQKNKELLLGIFPSIYRLQHLQLAWSLWIRWSSRTSAHLE